MYIQTNLYLFLIHFCIAECHQFLISISFLKLREEIFITIDNVASKEQWSLEVVIKRIYAFQRLKNQNRKKKYIWKSSKK